MYIYFKKKSNSILGHLVAVDIDSIQVAFLTNSDISNGSSNEELEVTHGRLPSFAVGIPSGEIFIGQVEFNMLAFTFLSINLLESFQNSGRFFGELWESEI